MIYLIAECSGKGFIKQPLQFSISGHVGDVWVLEDNAHGQRWAQEKVRFNEGQIVDKETAQYVVDAATDGVDQHGRRLGRTTLRGAVQAFFGR